MRFLLNFQDLEILVQPKSWDLFLRRPCRYLDSERRCSVRGTAAHPQICSHYNPHHCWYKRTLGAEARHPPLRLDHRRLALVLGLVRVSVLEDATYVPTLDEMRAVLAPTYGKEPPDDSFARQRADTAAVDRTVPSFDVNRSPCSSCTAVCCRLVRIPRRAPQSFGELDEIKYILGFDGVSAVVDSEDRWSIVVRTTCRHLDVLSNRCNVFGCAERPHRCVYLDEWRCKIRADFVANPGSLALISDPEIVTRIVSATSFGADGSVSRLPTYEQLRRMW